MFLRRLKLPALILYTMTWIMMSRVSVWFDFSVSYHFFSFLPQFHFSIFPLIFHLFLPSSLCPFLIFLYSLLQAWNNSISSFTYWIKSISADLFCLNPKHQNIEPSYNLSKNLLLLPRILKLIKDMVDDSTPLIRIFI